MRRIAQPFVLLMLVIVFGVIAYVQYDQLDQLNDIGGSQDNADQWDGLANRSAREYLRFREELTHIIDTGHIDLNSLQERYDIVVSRIHLSANMTNQNLPEDA